MAESNRLGISTMLSTDSHFQFGTRFAAFSDGNFHQLTDALLIQRLERILRKDSLVHVLQ